MSANLEQKLLLEQHLWNESFKEDASRVVRTDTVQGFIEDSELRIRELEEVISIAKQYL